MPAAIFNGSAVKILKDTLRFKNGIELSSTVASFLSSLSSDVQTQLDNKANTSLSNLSSVSISQDLVPNVTNTVDLGSSLIKWRDIYFEGVTFGSVLQLSSGLKIEAADSTITTIQGPASFGSNITLTLPPNIGSLNQILATNGSGITSWTNTLKDSSDADSINYRNRKLFAFGGVDSLDWSQSGWLRVLSPKLKIGDSGTVVWKLDVDGINQAIGVGGALASGQATGLAFLAYGTQNAGISYTNTSTIQLVVEDASASANPSTWNVDTNPVGFSVRYGNVAINHIAPQAALDVVSKTGSDSAIIFPRRASTERPASPVNGMMRYASDTNKFEAYENGAWTNVISSATSVSYGKQTFTLSASDITNQYIDLAQVASTNSIQFSVQGAGALLEGASYDYTVNYTGGAGGKTRITFVNDLATAGASALVAGDKVQVTYVY